MNASTRVSLGLSLLLAAGGAFAACGGDDGGGDPEPTNPNNPGNPGMVKPSTLKVLPSPAYSAFDGQHTFKIPFTVDKAKADKWTVSPADGADIEVRDDGVMLTIKKAGNFTVTAETADEMGQSKLTVSPYTPAQYEAGEKRYNNGKKALPNGIPTMQPAPGQMILDQNGACSSCHGATAPDLKVEHTPYQTGGYSDEELRVLLNEGKKPAGAVQRSDIPAFLWGMFHKWTVTPEEREGLVPYLRGLEPRKQMGFDYPIRMRPDGGLETRDGAVLGGSRDSGSATGGNDSGATTGGNDAGSTTGAEDAGVAAGDAG